LILPRTSIAKDFITGGQDTVAVRVPAHSIGLELIKQFENIGGQGIAAPSANRFGKVSPTNANAVQIELGNYLSQKDEILDGGFSTVGIESTIIDCSSNSPTILRPGGVSAQMVEDLLKIKLTNLHLSNYFKKAPGLLESHYSPNAQIILNGEPMPGDGFIALSEEKTPIGTIRLSAPVDTDQYAQDLYNSFRLGDTLKLSRIIAILPEGSGISVAIRDRLQKAAASKA